MLNWQPGPAQGNDPLELGELECGDTLLVLVAVNGRYGWGPRWEPQIIVPTETGFDDANGDTWGEWDWSDVEYFIKLDKSNLPPIEATNERRAK